MLAQTPSLHTRPQPRVNAVPDFVLAKQAKPINEGRHILHKANDVLLELRQPRALSRDDVNLHVLQCDKAMLGQRGAREQLPQFVIRKIPTRVHVITLAEFRHQSGRATIRHAFPFPFGKDAATHALARVLNCHHAILAR